MALLGHLFTLSNFSKLANLEAIPDPLHVTDTTGTQYVSHHVQAGCWSFGFFIAFDSLVQRMIDPA